MNKYCHTNNQLQLSSNPNLALLNKGSDKIFSNHDEMITSFSSSKISLSSTIEFIALTFLFIFCFICLFPEITLANATATPTSLESQLDKVGGLANGKLKTIGISAATILSAIWSVVRGNIKLAGGIVAIGVILALYLEWIAGGMKVV